MEKENMLVLQASDVRKALPIDETITTMKRAFATLSDGPVFIDDAEGEALALKIVQAPSRRWLKQM